MLQRLSKFSGSSKIIKIFNPNESRDEFGCPPRLCVNTYVGCSHQCAYCYNHWMNGFDKPHEKKDFEKSLKSDIDKIYKHGLDSLVISISNSTDPLQEPLESIHQHTLLALKMFSEKGLRVLILTKNPKKLLEQKYFDALNPATTALEITVPFLNDRKVLEPSAPSINERISSIEKLLSKGINKLAVRIDPLIPPEVGGQGPEEIEKLVGRLKDAGVGHVVTKVFRLVGAIQRVQPEFYQAAKKYYLQKGAEWHKNHYRLHKDIKHRLLGAVYDSCKNNNITMSVCYEDFALPGVVRCDMAESKLGTCLNS